MLETLVADHERLEFDVWNEVPLVPQLTGMSCWAAAAAMIIGWRDVIAADAEEVAAGAGHWAEYVDGLHPHQLEGFAQAWGLAVVRDPAWSVTWMRDLLERFGPVWLGEASPGLHSIVITGMYGDGSELGTRVRVNDPWPVGTGERYSLTWAELTRAFQAAAELGGQHVQMLHSGGRRGGPSGNYRFEERTVVRSTLNLPNDEDEIMSTTMRPPRHHEAYSTRRPSARGSAVGPVAAGCAYVDTTTASPNPLAGHNGMGENLAIIWNDMAGPPSTVDVVVHLHGYSSMQADAGLLRAKVPTSGIDLSGRARPTIAVIPRGRKISPDEVAANPKANPDRYTFPALLAGGGQGLDNLIAFALGYFRTQILGEAGGDIPVARRIITAHSGGGAALNALLGSYATRPSCDPHETHVFDALYGDTTALVTWVRSRMERDRALGADQLATLGGGLRIVYRDGTGAGSTAVAQVLPAAGDPLQPAYRADTTTAAHDQVAAVHEPMLLVDVRADLVTVAAAQGIQTRSAAYGAPMGLMQRYRAQPPAMGAIEVGRRSPATRSRRFGRVAVGTPGWKEQVSSARAMSEEVILVIEGDRARQFITDVVNEAFSRGWNLIDPGVSTVRALVDEAMDAAEDLADRIKAILRDMLPWPLSSAFAIPIIVAIVVIAVAAMLFIYLIHRDNLHFLSDQDVQDTAKNCIASGGTVEVRINRANDDGFAVEGEGSGNVRTRGNGSVELICHH